MIVFLLSGLWHGARWTFVLWGVLHGVFLISERLIKMVWEKKSIPKCTHPVIKYFGSFLQWFFVFHCIVFSWILFRSETMAQAHYIFTHLFTDIPEAIIQLKRILSIFNVIIYGVLIGLMVVVEYLQKNKQLYQRLGQAPIYLRWTLYYMLIFTIILIGRFGENAFIYFQF